MTLRNGMICKNTVKDILILIYMLSLEDKNNKVLIFSIFNNSEQEKQ